MMYESGTPIRGIDDSVYERRRLALVLACLGRTRYNRVLEIGCATGQLCALLNDRADEVVGLDASERALDVARGRTDAVRWVIGAAPRDIPDADFDLIVLSGSPISSTALTSSPLCARHGDDCVRTVRSSWPIGYGRQ